MIRTSMVVIVFISLCNVLPAQNESNLFNSNLNFVQVGSPMLAANYGLEQFDLTQGFDVLTGEAGMMSIGTDLQLTTIDESGLKNQQFAVFPTGSSFFSLNSLAFKLDGTGSDDVNSTVFYGDGPNSGMGGAIDFNTSQPTLENIENGLVLESSRDGVTNESSGAYFDEDVIIMWSPGDGFGTGSRIISIWEEDSASERWFIDNNGNPSSFSPPALNRSNQESLKDNLGKLNSISAFRYQAVQGKNQGELEKVQASASIGLDATELAQAIPEAVSINGQGDKFIAYNSIIPVLIGAIKELDLKSVTNDRLNEEVTQLKIELAALKKEVDKLTDK